MSPRPTRAVRLRDVAAGAGVSTSTASRVLNGGKPVSADLEQRVRAVADQLGYIPNLSAGALRGRRKLLAILADRLGGDALAEITAAVVDAGSKRDLVTLVSSGGEDPLAALRALRSMRPRALILTGGWLESPENRADVRAELDGYVRADGGRVAVFGAPIGEFAGVSFDDRGAGFDMARHAAERGASDVMILAGPRIGAGYQARVEGFLAGLEEAGVSRVRVVHCGIGRSEAADALGAALDQSHAPDLILCANDQTAVGAYDELERRALDVPGDVSVAGVDDLEVAQDLTPPLTTYRQPFREAGEKLVELALSDDPAPSNRIRLRGSVVDRASLRSR